MTTRRSRHRGWPYWAVVGVLVIIAIIVGYKVWEGYFKEGPKQFETTDQGGAQSGNKVEGNDESEDGGGNDDNGGNTDTTEPELEKKTEQYDGEDPNAGSRLTGVITYAGMSGNDLMVRVNIDQYLENGSCELQLMRNNNLIYNSTAEIVGSVTTSTCEGFNVSLDEIGHGEININILLTAGEKTGIIKGEVAL